MVGSKEAARKTYGQILLVGKDQKDSIAELILVEHALKLFASLNNTVAIVAVDDEDDTLGVLEVVPPQRTDLVLTTDIPHGELDVLVLDSLNVEALRRALAAFKSSTQIAPHSGGSGRQSRDVGRHTDGRDCGDNLAKLKLVKNGGFTGSIETDHQNTHLLLPPQLVENLRESETHDCG